MLTGPRLSSNHSSRHERTTQRWLVEREAAYQSLLDEAQGHLARARAALREAEGAGREEAERSGSEVDAVFLHVAEARFRDLTAAVIEACGVREQMDRRCGESIAGSEMRRLDAFRASAQRVRERIQELRVGRGGGRRC